MQAVSPETMQDAVLAWYSQNGRRDLPWRHTRDPYAILVSEVMLQQTQVARVAAALSRMARALADVRRRWLRPPLAEVIEAWAGLGYNRRAVSLHRCAQTLVEPGAVPPVGRESCGRCRGSGRTRLRRSPALPSGHRWPLPTPTPAACSSERSATADVEPPPGRAYEWNQALFDLGREICIARRPRCEECPLRRPAAHRAVATYAPLRKQSRFEGSFRQRRSNLLRAITAAGELPLAEARRRGARSRSSGTASSRLTLRLPACRAHDAATNVPGSELRSAGA